MFVLFPPSEQLSLPLLDGRALPLVVLPLLIELAVLGRGIYTRDPTDIVLAAVAVPCLLVSMWAVMEGLTPSGGVYWGGLFSMAVGGLLAFLVVMDTIVRIAFRVHGMD